MDLMMKHPIFLFSLLLLFHLSLVGQNYSINGQIECNNSQAYIYLAENIGGKYHVIDSSEIKIDGKFSFENDWSTGYYALWFDQHNYAQLILNNEDVIVQIKSCSLKDSLRIIQSIENQLLWDFIKENKRQKSMISQAYINKTKFDKNSIEYKSYQAIEDNLKQDLNAYIMNQYQNNKQTYFAKTIISDYPIENKKDFFKYIDFSNKNLIRSGVITKKITDFLQYHTEYTEEGFTESIDFILEKALADEVVYEFTLNYLLELFNAVGPDIILDYLVEMYVLDGACTELDITHVLNNKLEAYKKLKLGNQAPNVSIFNASGQMQNLHDLCSFSKINILFFGSSHCSFCQDAKPYLLNLAKENESNQLQIIHISLDTELIEWQKTLVKDYSNWVELSELKGWESKSTEIYQVHKTPSFYILDSQSKIISKPNNIDELLIEVGLIQKQ
jgi:thiol-disulfide isomerase/thioredoxin